MRRLLALILSLFLTISGAPALAVDDAMAPSEIDARIAELELRQREIDVRRPAIGTFVGAALTGTGVSIGAATAISCSPSGACSPEHLIGLGVSAVVLTIVGMATLIPSQRKLRARRLERRAIAEEIRGLEAGRARAPRPELGVAFHPDRGSRIVVGWTY